MSVSGKLRVMNAVAAIVVLLLVSQAAAPSTDNEAIKMKRHRSRRNPNFKEMATKEENGLLLAAEGPRQTEVKRKSKRKSDRNKGTAIRKVTFSPSMMDICHAKQVTGLSRPIPRPVKIKRNEVYVEFWSPVIDEMSLVDLIPTYGGLRVAYGDGNTFLKASQKVMYSSEIDDGGVLTCWDEGEIVDEPYNYAIVLDDPNNEVYRKCAGWPSLGHVNTGGFKNAMNLIARKDYDEAQRLGLRSRRSMEFSGIIVTPGVIPNEAAAPMEHPMLEAETKKIKAFRKKNLYVGNPTQIETVTYSPSATDIFTAKQVEDVSYPLMRRVVNQFDDAIIEYWEPKLNEVGNLIGLAPVTRNGRSRVAPENGETVMFTANVDRRGGFTCWNEGDNVDGYYNYAIVLVDPDNTVYRKCTSGRQNLISMKDYKDAEDRSSRKKEFPGFCMYPGKVDFVEGQRRSVEFKGVTLPQPSESYC